MNFSLCITAQISFFQIPYTHEHFVTASHGLEVYSEWTLFEYDAPCSLQSFQKLLAETRWIQKNPISEIC